MLILRKLDDLWWWCWALVIFDGMTAGIVITHAAVGLPEGSAALAVVGLRSNQRFFAGLYLVGLAKTPPGEPSRNRRELRLPARVRTIRTAVSESHRTRRSRPSTNPVER